MALLVAVNLPIILSGGGIEKIFSDSFSDVDLAKTPWKHTSSLLLPNCAQAVPFMEL